MNQSKAHSILLAVIILHFLFSSTAYAQKNEKYTKQQAEIKSLNKLGLYFPGVALE